MPRLKIRIYGDEVLRRKAEPVKAITPELVDLAREMLQAMYDAPGIGLAAPQVGVPIRLIVVDVSKEDQTPEPHIFFNPVVVPAEGDNPLSPYEEGCLSVPEIWANVMRPSRIDLTALNEKGESVELRNVDGLLARVIQHEVDHLDGVLFVDRISPEDLAACQDELKKMSRPRKKGV